MKTNVKNSTENVINNVSNLESTAKVKKVNELAAQKRKVNESGKNFKNAFKLYQRELSTIVYEINNFAKLEGSEAREFFSVCGLSIAPKNDKKRDSKRVYLTESFILDILDHLCLLSDDGTILKQKMNKETKIYEYVPEDRLTANKVLNILIKGTKIAIEKAHKQKQLQRVAEKNAAKKAAKQAEKAEKNAA